MNRPTLLASVLIAFLLHSPAHGAGQDVSAGTFSIYLENDLFAGTDRYYTSGVKLGWSSANLE